MKTATPFSTFSLFLNFKCFPLLFYTILLPSSSLINLFHFIIHIPIPCNLQQVLCYPFPVFYLFLLKFISFNRLSCNAGFRCGLVEMKTESWCLPWQALCIYSAEWRWAPSRGREPWTLIFICLLSCLLNHLEEVACSTQTCWHTLDKIKKLRNSKPPPLATSQGHWVAS